MAIVGMLLVNSGPEHMDGAWGYVWTSAHGRASLLFVLLAGVGTSLLARGRPRLVDHAGILAWRSALLLAIGVLLGLLDHQAQVILPTYALLFALAIVLVRVPTRWLVVGAAVGGVVGPVLVLVVLQLTERVYDRTNGAKAEDPVEALDTLVMTGPYPLVTWLVPFVVGMLIGRADLRGPRTAWAMVGWGAAAAVVALVVSRGLVRLVGAPTSRAGFDHLVVLTPHSQMPLWLLGSTGAAVVVLGVALVATPSLGRLSRPLASTGQLALTAYVGHLLVLHLLPDRPLVTVGALEVPLAVPLVLGTVLLAWAWRAVFPWGPAEVLMRPPWVWAAERRRVRSQPAPGGR
ncbi:hypothetical protein N869_04060 [Cellulomonas bogoriensis 69B4 = DSM 16987]|uniref:DUF418 domain-containing protein n=1 Tax=Cellulomonas bogoriensis 69B4 = DSM 16987 TaxID=1386082 RepID=A0A0A0BUY7_9CELL|nr:hypothetical protein N869_04060 [Cellulomonas bogoriensis 69B4 = DSM 16987]